MTDKEILESLSKPEVIDKAIQSLKKEQDLKEAIDKVKEDIYDYIQYNHGFKSANECDRIFNKHLKELI